MQLTIGSVDSAQALIDLGRNEFAPFPYDHELVFNERGPSGFTTGSERDPQPLGALPWRSIPFGAQVRSGYHRRARR